ncbi:hypothetical protein ROZALSC1DRAFT_29094 [Rozella allomycis CSF55]|uniref:Cytochrome b5 heme-binding domain-containing protein n=1 Tax=Rozella allomycis (strain CSF55) TaxID=988480 RepID=A0A4P9YLB0_ROZAC|nr:hypothetical protein ROZALSC1DRAFT_29094 [Rozella allomycis CSF55]
MITPDETGNYHNPHNILTRIHGKWYDLTEFASKHPGGSTALRLAAGRDATVMFQSQHVFSSNTYMKSVLEKYRIKDKHLCQSLKTLEEIDSERLGHEHGLVDNVYDWPEGGSEFTKEVVGRVKEYFIGEAKRRGISLRESIKATPRRYIEMVGTFAMFLLSLYWFFQGYFITLLVTPAFAWIFAANSFHDAAHYAVSTKPWVNRFVSYLSPYFSSPTTWALQHNVAHHSYTNMAHKDPDVAHASYIRRDHPDFEWLPVHGQQVGFLKFSIHILFAVFGLIFMNEYETYLSGKKSYNESVPIVPQSKTRIAIHLVGRLLTISFIFFWPFFILEQGLGTKLMFSIMPFCLFSLFFMMNTQLNHLVPEALEENSRDFYVHEVLTSNNFGEQSYLHYILSGGLNMQAEHHLFPTVNQCHLMKIQPIVKEVCMKYKVPYHMCDGYFDGMKKYIIHSCNMAKKP